MVLEIFAVSLVLPGDVNALWLILIFFGVMCGQMWVDRYSVAVDWKARMTLECLVHSMAVMAIRVLDAMEQDSQRRRDSYRARQGRIGYSAVLGLLCYRRMEFGCYDT